MLKKSKWILVILSIVLIMSFISWYVGHFLLKQNQQPIVVNSPTAINTAVTLPVTHKHLSVVINGNQQEINILEITMNNRNVEIKPVLSYDLMYGFEKLSVIAQRHKAYAAVNAGFFYEYGQPSGMVAIDGRLVSKSSGKYPVFLSYGGKAAIKQIENKLFAKYNNDRIPVDDINVEGKEKQCIVYTPDYGENNRVKGLNTTVTVIDGVIKDIDAYDGKVSIPKNGMLFTFFNSLANVLNEFSFKKGDRLEFEFEPYLGENLQAYECGSWLIRDGKIVIGERDEWVGIMTNQDPRTAVGVMDDGDVILITVDGRQPGYSAGFMGKELAQYLLNYGIKDAAMLDGGASTEMIIDGKIVNKPSFKGQERPLGGGIIIKIKE